MWECIGVVDLAEPHVVFGSVASGVVKGLCERPPCFCSATASHHPLQNPGVQQSTSLSKHTMSTTPLASMSFERGSIGNTDGDNKQTPRSTSPASTSMNSRIRTSGRH